MSERDQAALVASCTPCEDPAGHQYDDDRSCFLWGWSGPWSRLGGATVFDD